MDANEIVRNPFLITAMAIAMIYAIGNLFIKRENVELVRQEQDATRDNVYLTLVQDNIKRLAVLELRFEELSGRYSETVKELGDTRVALSESEARVRELENEVEILQKKNMKLEQENKSIRAELEMLRARLSEYERKDHGG